MSDTQKQLTAAELEAIALKNEEKKLELDERRLALESRKIQDELARIELTEKKQILQTKKDQKQKGNADARKAIEDLRALQHVCNHHCGGEYGTAVRMGQGDLDRKACLGGIKFVSGLTRFMCLRCGKTWWSDMPNGGERDGKLVGPWNEGIALWKKNQNKQIAVVGGLKVEAINPPVQVG